MTESDATIERVVRGLRVVAHQWILVVGAMLLLGGAAYVYSKSQPDEYQARASLLFRDPQFDQKLFGSQFFSAANDSDRNATTNAELVALESVAQRTSQELGARYTPTELTRKVTAESKGRSDVVDVVAVDGNAQVAATIANTWARSFISVRRDADRSKVAEAERLVARSIAELPTDDDSEQRRTLLSRQQQLRILTSLQTGKAELAQPALVPAQPVGPLPLRNTILGLFAGFLLGALMAFIRDRLDRRLKTADEVRAIFGRPVLGTVAESSSLGTNAHLRIVGTPEAETFRLLRASLRYFSIDEEIRSVVLASGGAGDGKSVIALQLALASARAGTPTLLVETDLRRPTLAQKLGMRSTHTGLSDYLTGRADFDSAVTSISTSEDEVDPDAVAGATLPRLDVAFAGPLPPNPADLLESQRMLEFIDAAEERYELVVLDASPITVIADSIPVLRRANGILVVVRLGKSTKDESEALHARLENLNVSPLGVVLNGANKTTEGYGYAAYGYSATGTNAPEGLKPPVARA